MFKLVALAAFAATALALKSDNRITVSPSSSDDQPIPIDEGFNQVFTFKLTQPIACPADNAQCHVIIALTNTHPDQVNVDNCHVKWAAHEWHQPRYITVSAKEDFVDDIQSTFRLITETADSASLFYDETEVADIVLQTKPRPSANCHATGDPHYKTWDGFPFHIFPSGKAVLYKSTDPERFFEVQTDSYEFSGRPAVQCGVAARENNDVIVIDLCRTGREIDVRRSCGSQECLSGSWPKLGITNAGLPRYTINFKSGAQVRINVGYWSTIGRRYMNVYVTAPGVDYGRTVGLCGNNDGIKSNDINVGHNGWIRNRNLLDANQLVVSGSASDLFRWYPTAETMIAAPTLPPFAEECDFEPEPFVRPILNQPNVEDIADLIKNTLPDEANQAEGITFTLDDDALLPELMSRDAALAICVRLRDTAVARACVAKFPTIDLDSYIQDCVEDVVETSDTLFLEIAVSGLEDECADLGNRDLETWENGNDGQPLEPSNDLQGVICPTSNDKPCSGNGVCSKTICTCNPGFRGIDCGIDTSAAAVVDSLARPFCDGRGIKGCDPQVSVFGRNFFRRGNFDPLCKFGDLAPTAGFILGSIEMLCQLPTTRFSGQSAETVSVSVSFDNGTTWTPTSPDIKYTWYDSVCEVCNSSTCTANPDSCNIDGQCYLATEFNDANQCLQCVPATSTSDWTFSYVHSLACGPRFDAMYYEATIVKRAAAGEELITMDATNALTKDDATTSITYSLTNADRHPLFRINSQTGVVTTTSEIVVSPQLQFAWHGTMLIVATDSKGNRAETNLHIDIIEVNADPIFESKVVNITLREDDAVGTAVTTLTARDTGTDANLSYAWLSLQQGHPDTFALDPSTGAVTLAQSLDFETLASYTMQVAATDNAGQFDSATLNVLIEDVNEAPTGLRLNATEIMEEDAAAVIGSLTADDQDSGDSHTFAIKDNAPFVVVDGNVLKTSAAFDFETTKSAQVTVIATDAGGLTYEQIFDLSVVNVNEAPTAIAIDQTRFAEDVAAVGNELTFITATDPDADDTVLCTLRDDDNGHFVIEDMRLILLKELDFETTTSHSIDVWCEDISGLGMSKRFELTVDNAHEAPKNVEFVQAAPIAEDTPVGTVVGTISAIDEDADAGDMQFSVVAPSGESKYFSVGPVTCDSNVPRSCSADVIVDAPLDFDINPSAPLVIRAADNTQLASLTELEVELSNVNEAPRGIAWIDGSASVTEGAPVGTLVGQLLVDDEDEAVEYTFTLQNAASSPFELVRNSNRRSVTSSVVNVQVRDPSAFDAQVAPSVSIAVQVVDGAFTNVFTADVAVVDAPLALSFADGELQAVVDENVPAGTLVGKLAVSNVNADETVQGFAITGGSGLTNNLVIVDNELRVAVPLDHERTAGIPIQVTATIEGGRGSVDQALIIRVANVDEAPVFTGTDGKAAPDNVLLDVDTESGVSIGQLIVRDPEGDDVTVTLSEDGSNALTLQSSGAVGFGGHELLVSGRLTAGKHNVRITATSGNGLVTHHDMVLRVAASGKTDPAAASSGSSSSNSGATVGIVVGILVVIVLIAVIAFFVIRRKDRSHSPLPTSSFQANQTFDNPTFKAPEQDFVAGVNNPMYEWYAPDLSRSDATNELTFCQPGAFVVRDSQATPGWHILGVKTNDAVLHEKIRMDEEGLYELIPSNQQPQPAFHTLPDLVHYYAQNRDGMEYALDFSSFDNPLYAAFQDQMQGNKTYASAEQWRRDVDAPVVPLKEKDMAMVAQLTQQDDIYTNAAEASAALMSTNA